MLVQTRFRTSMSASVKVSLVAVFAATALGTNYALIDIPNVKLMDALVFIAAYLFGLDVGLGSAFSIWIVYGLVNPYGVDDPLTLSFVIIGECFYVLSAVGLSRTGLGRKFLATPGQISLVNAVISVSALVLGTMIVLFPEFFVIIIPRFLIYPVALLLIGLGIVEALRVYFGGASLVFGLVGLAATFTYDIFTNFGSWLFKTTTIYQALIVGITTGVPFAILHEASNLVLFATVVPSAIVATKRLRTSGSTERLV